MQNKSLKKIIISAFFLAIGLVLPSIFHMFGAAGKIFLPMHIPVILCGFICGWQYGLVCGIVTPLLSSVLTSMPVLIPFGVSMMFELGTYGMICGFLYQRFNKNIIISLVIAMIGGRIVSCLANMIILGIASKPFAFNMFLTGAFVTALPGIIIQLVLIPILMMSLEKTGQLSKIK